MRGKSINGNDGSMATASRVLAALVFGAMAVPAADVAVPAGLVLHFDFDKAPADGVIPDQSGKNNDGKVAGAKWTTSGKKGGGLESAVAQSGARVAASPTLVLERATIGAWFKSAKAHPHPRHVLGSVGFRLTLAGDPEVRGKLAAEIGGGPRCLSDAVVTNDDWHHAAATFDGTQMKLYIDGMLQKQVGSCSVPLAAESGGLVIGMNLPAKEGQPENVHSLDGVMDEVMVFNRALSAEEIKSLVVAIDPKAGTPKPKFTKAQLAGEIKRLEQLYAEGLLTDAYYTRKVRELEAAAEE